MRAFFGIFILIVSLFGYEINHENWAKFYKFIGEANGIKFEVYMNYFKDEFENFKQSKSFKVPAKISGHIFFDGTKYDYEKGNLEQNSSEISSLNAVSDKINLDVKNENGELKGKIIVKNKAYNATIKKEKEYEMLNIGIQMTEANGTRYEAIINDIFAKESAKKNKNKLLSTLYDLKSERKKWPNNQFESLDNIYYINDKIKSICTYKNNKTSCDVVLLKTNKKLKLKQIFKDMNDPHLKAILATAGVSENFVLSPLGLTFLNEEQISVPLDELRPYFSDEIGL
ncbi:S-adenosylmethionine tRNA ribosyltransferase [Campylobacter concisus]|uniref:S-adenosylmethionine tRNA ribosyltransferase n=1 Tax=Campylobacter concisus TaxID=199 RepID=UPI00122CE305|nr:S-adenosylmethionine tRNA ribosyltransferase [Campylobacter concisus]